jgi:predicted ribosomally synthesized peptide with nif11-like leader
MSLEQLKAFLAKVRRDSSLQEKLKVTKSPGEVVTIAKEHGHEFTVDKISLLSQEELEGVAGGHHDHTDSSPVQCTWAM